MSSKTQNEREEVTCEHEYDGKYYIRSDGRRGDYCVHCGEIVWLTGIIGEIDADADAPVYSLIDPPAGIVIDSASGRITGTPKVPGTHILTVSRKIGH